MLLKDHGLEEFLKILHTKRSEMDNLVSMKEIVLENALEWKTNKPYHGKEVIN